MSEIALTSTHADFIQSQWIRPERVRTSVGEESQAVAFGDTGQGKLRRLGRPPMVLSKANTGAGDLRLVFSKAREPLVLAGCVGLGLAAIGVVFLVARRTIRRWRDAARQRQRMQEEFFWNLLDSLDSSCPPSARRSAEPANPRPK
jgi:hypothetical protein